MLRPRANRSVRALLVPLALLLAGCTFPAPPEEAPPPADAPPCGRVEARANRSILAPGEGVVIDATVLNCGSAPWEVREPGCGQGGVRAFVARDNRSWPLVSGTTPSSTEAPRVSCGPFVVDPAPRTVAPGGALLEWFAWNGTFAEWSCDESGTPENGTTRACRHAYQPAEAGTYDVAVVAATRYGHEWMTRLDLHVIASGEG